MPDELRGRIRVGRHNPHTLYWAPEGSSPRDSAEEPIGCAFTPEWAKRIAALSEELDAARRVIAGMPPAAQS